MRKIKKILSFVIAAAIVVQTVSVTPVLKAETKASQGQTLYDAVKADFKQVRYEDFFNILNPYVSGMEKIQIQTQLTKELGKAPTQEELNQRISQIYLDRLDMRGSFENVMNELDEILPKAIGDSFLADKQYLLNNRTQILLGLTYLDRYYSFSANGIMAKEILLYQLELIGSSTYDALAVITGIGNNLDYNMAKGNKTADVYENCLAWVTGMDDITVFVEAMAATEDITGGVYLKSHSKAVIREGERVLFEKMKQDTRLKQYLLPLLNLSSESIYVISTGHTTTFGLTATYGGVNDIQFQQRLDITAKAQQDFLEFWQRISTTSDRLNITPELILIDTLAVKGQTGQTTSQRWSPESGANADVGVRELITPMNHYRTYLQAGAEAGLDGNLIQFFMDYILTDTGINTYTHELTHVYDRSVWLNGKSRRNNCGNETFARGLFESENNTQPRDGGASPYMPYFNLNTAYTLGDNRIQNQSPERFQTTEDIQEYMHGIMDVLYTLDLIEAEEILKLSDADKSILFNQVSLVDDPKDTQGAGRKLDSFTNITETEAAALKTIDDLVEKNIVSGRLIPKGSQTTQTTTYNDYIVVPMFEGVYAGIQNDNGMVGDFLFRRYTHELLAEYGWEDGLIAYTSNQYANDKEALTHILGEKYQGSLKAFKKDMFKQRADKMKYLKPTASYQNVEEMRTAIREALKNDLISIKKGIAGGTNYYMLYVKEVQNTKADIFKEYLLQTDDFRSSIYEEKTEYLVGVTSKLLGSGTSVAPISMSPSSGCIKAGEQVTVTAQDMLGYSFKGWYFDTDLNEEHQIIDGRTALSNSFAYSYTPDRDAMLVAVYEAVGTAEVTFFGSGYTVSVDGGEAFSTQDDTYVAQLPIGSEVKVTVTDESFINWLNEHKKIVTTEHTYTFIVTGDMSLTMSKKGEAGATALVTFVSAYNQVIASKIYDSDDTIVFPDGPSKMGYTFNGWSLSQQEIHTKITNRETHIKVTPVYTQDTKEIYTLTVYVNEIEDPEQTVTDILPGMTKMVYAPEINGRVFLYWTDADDNILGYDTSYFMQVNKNMVVKAVYGEEEVTAKPVIAMTNIFTTSDNGKNKISFSATRDIPKGYILLEHGMIANKTGFENPTEDNFILGAKDVSKLTSTATKLSGVFTLNINMTGKEDVKVAVRGYLIVKNQVTGKEEVYYSKLVHCTYHEVVSD